MEEGCYHVPWKLSWEAKEVAQLTKSLSSTKEPWVQSPHTWDAVVHTCSLSTWDLEAGGSGVQGLSRPHNGLEANVSYVKPCLKTKHYFCS